MEETCYKPRLTGECLYGARMNNVVLKEEEIERDREIEYQITTQIAINFFQQKNQRMVTKRKQLRAAN